MYCPGCRAEFVNTVTMCANCNIKLVENLPEVEDFNDVEQVAKKLQGKELIPIAVGSYQELKEVQQILAESGIMSLLSNDENELVFNAALSRYFILIDAEKRESTLQTLNDKWQENLLNEGLIEHIEMPDIDICPACETQIDDGLSECPDCGLVLA